MRIGDAPHIGLTELEGVVNALVAHDVIGRGPDHSAGVGGCPTEKITRLENDCRTTLECQAECGGDAGESTTDDDDGGSGV